MSNALCHSRTGSIAAILAGALFSVAGSVRAQAPVWSQQNYGSYPSSVNSNVDWRAGLPPGTAGLRPQAGVAPIGAPRGRLARLVRNPTTSAGLPPFALADQMGTIQRLVEPVPGIDLESFVGEVVNVRHDTGQTLLATQLELPPRPLRPMVDADPIAYGAHPGNLEAPAGMIIPTRFIDDDDETTQLENDNPAGSGEAVRPIPSNGGPARAPAGNQEALMFYDGMVPIEVGPIPGGPAFAAPMYPGPVMAAPLTGNAYPGAVVIDGMGGPCPQCGGYHQAPGSGQACSGQYGYAAMPYQSAQPAKRDFHFFGDVEANFLRVHVMEEAVGKLSEKYEFSPRFIVGVDGPGNFDARARYWIYDRDNQILGGGSVHFDFRVLDVEAIHRFPMPAAEVVLAAGVRFANIELVDRDDNGTSVDLIGATLAADANVPLYVFQLGQLAWVCGGRLSILGGDWVGSNSNDFVEGRVQDDNVVAHEIYGGVQFDSVYRGVDLHARAAFEIQNWHSDALAQTAGTDSIGFIGPGVQVGAAY